MVSPYSRFVVHYRDGETYMEDKEDPYAWDRLEHKDNILALGIKMDPQYVKSYRIERPVHLLFSSKTKRYFFFQTKVVDRINPDPSAPYSIPRIDKEGKVKGWFNCHRIGMVVTPQGNCIVKDVDPVGNCKTYFTTLDSILPHANLELFGIELDRVGEPIDTKV